MAAVTDVRPTPEATSKTWVPLKISWWCNMKSARKRAPRQTCSPTKSSVVALWCSEKVWKMWCHISVWRPYQVFAVQNTWKRFSLSMSLPMRIASSCKFRLVFLVTKRSPSESTCGALLGSWSLVCREGGYTKSNLESTAVKNIAIYSEHFCFISFYYVHEYRHYYTNLVFLISSGWLNEKNKKWGKYLYLKQKI